MNVIHNNVKRKDEKIAWDQMVPGIKAYACFLHNELF